MTTRTFNRHIPNDAHLAIKRLAENADIHAFAFTRNHGARGWLVVNSNNKWDGFNLPVKLVQKIEEFEEAGSKIQWVAFPGSGNRWSILLENGFFNRRVPDDLHDKMHALHRDGHRFNCLAFPRNSADGWALVTDRGEGFYSRDIPEECQVIARNINQGTRKVHHVSFTPSGGWFLAADDYLFARDIGAPGRKANDFRGDGRVIHSITFDLDGDGWSVISNETFSSKPNDPLRGFESRVNNQTIWQEMRQINAPGASVVIVRDNEIFAELGYGQQKRGDDRAARATTLYQAASISKVVTAVGVMRAVEMGLLDLDDPVRSVRGLNLASPDVNSTGWNDCTLRLLLAHMGGIAGNGGGQSVGGYSGYGSEDELPTQKQILLGIVGAIPRPDLTNPGRAALIVYNPGTGRRYSGPGYQVIQGLLAEAAGESFPAWMKENVLDPLNMHDSFFNVEIPQRYFNEDRVAAGHARDGSVIDDERLCYPQYAAAGLYSTPIDLAQVLIMMNQDGAYEGRQFLTPSSVTELLTIQNPSVSPIQGLGWRMNIVTPRCPGISSSNFHYGHGGSNTGFHSWMVGYPNQDGGAGLIVMSNTDNSNFRYDVGCAIIDRFGWD